MYGGGINLVHNRDLLGRRRLYSWGHSSEKLWKKTVVWKVTGVRGPEALPSEPWAELFIQRNKDYCDRRCPRAQNVSRGSANTAQVWSRFVATGSTSLAAADKSRFRRVTEAETDEVCPVPLFETDASPEQLPLQVSLGLTLESVGYLYQGPNEDKYWSQIRCTLQHPYPVGYTAIKTYRGLRFKQTIEEGPDGPVFVVGEVNKDSHSADSPAKAWAVALANSPLKSTTRIHGRKHFGFDCPMVLGLLLQLDKNGLAKRVSNVQSKTDGISERTDVDKTGRSDEDTDLEGDKHTLSGKWESRGVSAQQQSPPPSNEAPGLIYNGSGHSIRLRNIMMASLSETTSILSCGDDKHPATEGLLETIMTNHFDKESATAGDLLHKEFATSRRKLVDKQRSPSTSHTILKHGLSVEDSPVDSILRGMDEAARIDGHVGLPEKTVVHDKGPTQTENIRVQDPGLSKKSSSRNFSPSVHRSTILFEESASKDSKSPGHTRSLANLLEDWNRGTNSRSLGKSKLQPGLEQSSPPPPLKTPLASSIEVNSVTEPTGGSLLTGFPNRKDEDMENRVKQWGSGKEGRSTVLKEIRQLVVENSVDQALEILRTLHSRGAHLDNADYSVFFPFTLDNWQRQAVELVQQSSVVVCAPGGAGKFVVACRCLYQAIAQGEQCVFVTPCEISARDRQQQLEVLFGRTHMGSLRFKAESGQSFRPITVVSLECFLKGLRDARFHDGPRESEFFAGLRFAVMDRFHTVGDAEYGSLWEEAVMLLDQKVNVIALSLPLKAPEEIASWLSRVHRPYILACCNFEPVQKLFYYCDTSGLHPLEKANEARQGQQHDVFLTGVGDAPTDHRPSIRSLLRSLQTERLLPLAISFSNVEDCVLAVKDAREVLQGHVSPYEVTCIEERIEIFLKKHADIERFVSKEDKEYLKRGFGMYHEGQLTLWTEFIQELVHNNLVKVIFGTDVMLCRTQISFQTVALITAESISESPKLSRSRSGILQLLGKAGRRGLDLYGNMVFVGNKEACQEQGARVASDDALGIRSHFVPSYSLLLNLLTKHTLSEVRELVESNYGDFVSRLAHKEELRELEEKVLAMKERKAKLEKELYQELTRINNKNLADATIFCHVDVRTSGSGPPWAENVLPGILCAVLPGPSELLYGILCADNNFRLLPAGALSYVYTKEQRLDWTYEYATGQSLRVPALPAKKSWKRTIGDRIEYVSEGTKETSRIVDALLQYGPNACEPEWEHKEELKSCYEQLATLYGRQEQSILSTKNGTTAAWATSEKLIDVLQRANAMESMSGDTSRATLKPLGVLVSKLHFVENELWYAVALSSNAVKPLTAPELAIICAALVDRGQQTDSRSSGPVPTSLNKDTPRRLRAALEKLETLRKQVEVLQGSVKPALHLDGQAVAIVHSLFRETLGQEQVQDLKYPTMLLVQRTVKLLHIIGDVWSRSTHVLSALDGASGLHNLAKRAALTLQKAIEPTR